MKISQYRFVVALIIALRLNTLSIEISFSFVELIILKCFYYS